MLNSTYVEQLHVVALVTVIVAQVILFLERGCHPHRKCQGYGEDVLCQRSRSRPRQTLGEQLPRAVVDGGHLRQT